MLALKTPTFTVTLVSDDDNNNRTFIMRLNVSINNARDTLGSVIAANAQV